MIDCVDKNVILKSLAAATEKLEESQQLLTTNENGSVEFIL